MNDNVIKIDNGQILIVNGGNPLNDCPDDYATADAWAEEANKDAAVHDPKWKWDCGFKLDFDGSLITVSSRFYPPKTHYGPKWDGAVHISFLDEEISRKEFEEDTLEDLKAAVEKHLSGIVKSIKESVLSKLEKDEENKT